MAREIYADPFGSYITGYDTGAQRQMAQEQNVRAAREVDWNYYNMKPIELATAQRNNEFQAYGDQFQRSMLPIGVDKARAGLFNDQFQASQPFSYMGLMNPMADAMKNYSGYGYVNSDQGTQFYGPHGGGAVGPMITPQAANAVYPDMRKEQYARDQDAWMRQYQVNTQALEAQRNAAYAASVQAQADAAAARVSGGGGIGYGAGTPVFNYLWGSQSPFGGTAPTAAAPTPPVPTATGMLPPEYYPAGGGK